MKKFLSVLLTAIITVSFSGCAGAPSNQADTPAESSDSATETSAETPADTSADSSASGSTDIGALKVALLMPGSVNDQGWNTMAYNGLLDLEANYGCEIQFSENVAASDVEEFLRGYASQGFNVVFSHGTQFTDATKKVAESFPDVKFVISTSANDTQEPNVACMSFKAGEAGFLAGAVAAAISTSGKVAFLGGEESPSISPVVDYFSVGAKYVNPDIEAMTGYIGSLTDSGMAKEMALSMESQGADVFSASANSAGLGVIEAAQETGNLALGYNSDQNSVAPDTVATSVLRNVGMAQDFIVNYVAEGTFEPKLYAFGVADDVVYLTPWFEHAADLPEGYMEKIEKVLADFKAGLIDCGEL